MKKQKIISMLAIIIILFILYCYTNIVDSRENQITYKAHVQDIGWQGEVQEENEAGTTGRALRMEAIIINNNNRDFEITYKAHVQDIGWQEWKKQGEEAGTTGRALRLEAIQINLENLSNNKYEIEYRVHVQDIGWQEWRKQGEIAGTTGRALRAEAIQIRIIKNNNIDSEITIKNGIDVSKYQGDINWTKVKSSGIDFAIIRAGYRGYGTSGTLVTDSKFRENIQGAIRNNIDVGVYFFSQAITENEAIEEANYVLNLVKDYKITYPIVIDTEDVSNATGRADNLSKGQRTKIAETFCESIKNSGYKPMIYANKWWLKEQLDMNVLEKYDVWIAHYTGAIKDNPFAKPSDYDRKYSIWQYTDKGKIDGITGYVDLDITVNK